jgi:hypothetical protein
MAGISLLRDRTWRGKKLGKKRARRGLPGVCWVLRVSLLLKQPAIAIAFVSDKGSPAILA